MGILLLRVASGVFSVRKNRQGMGRDGLGIHSPW